MCESVSQSSVRAVLHNFHHCLRQIPVAPHDVQVRGSQGLFPDTTRPPHQGRRCAYQYGRAWRPYWAEKRVKPRSAKHSRSTMMVRRASMGCPFASWLRASNPLTANSISDVPWLRTSFICGRRTASGRRRPRPFQTCSRQWHSPPRHTLSRPSTASTGETEGFVEQVVLFLHSACHRSDARQRAGDGEGRQRHLFVHQQPEHGGDGFRQSLHAPLGRECPAMQGDCGPAFRQRPACRSARQICSSPYQRSEPS